MGYQVFTEKEINLAINKKAPLEDVKGKKHKIGKLIVNGEYYGKVKIPNPHKNEFRENKAKNLSKQLQLNDEQYNKFINCSMKKSEYEEIVKNSSSSDKIK